MGKSTKYYYFFKILVEVILVQLGLSLIPDENGSFFSPPRRVPYEVHLDFFCGGFSDQVWGVYTDEWSCGATRN